MEVMRNTTLVEIRERKRALGMRSHRWDYNIKNYPKDVGCACALYICLTLDRLL